MDEQRRLIGVDGARGGWVAAIDDGDALALRFVERLGDLPVAAVVAIDIPLGFPTGSARRPAESAARRRLGPRRSSVFSTPPRAVLECGSYDDARTAALRETGRSISKQAWNLRPKVLEAAAADRTLHEVHPELAFAVMCGGPMPNPKRTSAGRLERVEALSGVGLGPDRIAGWDDVPREDAVDALACLWVARRVWAGTAEALGTSFGPDDGPIHV